MVNPGSHVSRRRSVRAVATGLSNVAAKGLAGVIALASIPLTLDYLGPERFGLWMTIASLSALLAFADFGLGSGLLHVVAGAFGRKEHELLSGAIRNALRLQCVVAGLLLAGFLIAYPSVDWAHLLNVSGTPAHNEAGPALLIFVTTLLIRSVVLIVQSAQLGMRPGYIANIWIAGGNVLAFGGLFVAARFHADVPTLCLVVTGLPVLAGLLNAVWWVLLDACSLETGCARRHRSAHHEPHDQGRTVVLRSCGSAAALNVGVDPLIVSRILIHRLLAKLSIVQKPFELLATLLLLLFIRYGRHIEKPSPPAICIGFAAPFGAYSPLPWRCRQLLEL